MILAALALVGCQDLGVSYHVGVSSGVSSFDRPVSDFNTQTAYVGVSFSPFQARHYKRTEELQVAFAERARVAEDNADTMRELALADLAIHRGTTVEAVQDTADDGYVDAEAEADLTDYVPPIAETTEKAWPFLIWASAVAILAAAIGGLWWIGFPLPTIPPRKKAAPPEPKPEDTD